MIIAVLGAGLAGLAAACDVADAGCRPLLFERRPFAGGKTYSFVDRETGAEIDNGQHVAMRCTTAYIDFLGRIGSAHLIDWQPRLRVPVLDADGRRSDLAAASLPSPLHLAASFAVYKHLSLADKARIGRAIVAMLRLSETQRLALDATSFGDWLRARGQSVAAISGFWDLIVVPALNCRCDDASAAQALFLFREGFLKSASAAAIGLPRTGLSRLHVEPAVRYIEQRGGELRTGAAIERIEMQEGRVAAALLASGERIVADAFIAALPPNRLLELLPDDVAATAPFAALAEMRTAPIVNVHLWFDAPISDVRFAAFTGCDLQWIFRPATSASIAPTQPRGEHVVVSLSAAERYMPLDKSELLDLLLPQLRRALPRARTAKLLRSAVIKEPDATFVPSPGLRRPGVSTPIPNLFLAGAYTDTGWPATMESAVRSGRAAAYAALQAAPLRAREDIVPNPDRTAVPLTADRL